MKIARCPFCKKSNAHTVKYGFNNEKVSVICPVCGASGDTYFVNHYSPEKEATYHAIRQWNYVSKLVRKGE